MELDFDTFLTAVYVTVDDLYQAMFAASKPPRPGPKPALSDSEVLTLSLLAQWQRGRSERGFLRWAARHWRAYFPCLLSQSAFNRRARDLWVCSAPWGRGWPGGLRRSSARPPTRRWTARRCG